jgi:hypothetical protein
MKFRPFEFHWNLLFRDRRSDGRPANLPSLPVESVVNFVDTVRVPCGTKSARIVQNFAMQDAHFLMRQCKGHI